MNTMINALIGVFLVIPTPAIAAETPTTSPVVVVEQRSLTIKEKILATFEDKRMVDVLWCESNHRQLVNGKPLISPTSDVGVAQINQVHWKEAKALGLDIFNSEDDNLKMAKKIYARQGIKAWMALYSDCYARRVRDV